MKCKICKKETKTPYTCYFYSYNPRKGWRKIFTRLSRYVFFRQGFIYKIMKYFTRIKYDVCVDCKLLCDYGLARVDATKLSYVNIDNIRLYGSVDDLVYDEFIAGNKSSKK